LIILRGTVEARGKIGAGGVKVCKEKRVVSMYVCVGVCVCVYMYVGGEEVEVAASFFSSF
jgi:hypothetical protein